MSAPTEALRQAIARHRAGQLPEAERLYRQVLAAEPSNPDALQLLGVLALQAGNPSAAVALIRQALVLRPMDPQAHYNLGNALQALGDGAGALAAFQQAVALAPQMAEARGNLGTLLAMAGRFDEALPHLREAVRRAPRYVQGWNSLANALRETGRFDEAIESYRSALRADPAFAPAQFGLGLAFAQAGRYAEAEQAYRQTLRRSPDSADVWNNLGALLRLVGRLDESLACFERVGALSPNLAQGHYNRGLVLAGLDRLTEAEAAQRRALALDPGLADAWDSLGVALQSQGRIGEAIDSYRHALATRPDHAVAATNYGTALQAQGRHAEALAAFEVALQVRPRLAATRSNQLMTRQYMAEETPATLLAAAQTWARHHAPASASKQFSNPPDPERPLRVGYLSSDFRSHSCAWFLEPLLAAHDRTQVTVSCFFTAAQPDALTARFRSLASGWHDVVPLDDAAVVDLVRREGIDILVDCNGHTAGNRLPVLALRTAPVQVTWLGFPGTTGVPAIDYRLTDAVADPADAEAFCSERLMRLPHGFLCYQPPAAAPAVVPPPALTTDHVTFGSFNNPSKLTDNTIAAWSRIVTAVPRARLMLKARQFLDPATRELFLARFAAHGLGRDRIDLLPGTKDLHEHLARYGDVDLTLDPFPYNGTTTTCEALWMGVPVLALRGDRHAGRVGASLLTQLGLTELIADSLEDHVAQAVALAGDLSRLSALRSGLRDRMAASPLVDRAGFARAVEAAYRTMWRRWCAVQRGA